MIMLLKDPEFIFVVLVILQVVSIFIGLITGKQHNIEIKSSSVIAQRLVDPLTYKVGHRFRDYKYKWFKQGKWTSLFALIFLKKLVLLTLITRVLYGIIFIIPLLLTIWLGFSQGVSLAKSKKKINLAFIFDNIGLLLGSVLGISLGVDVFELLFRSMSSFSGQLPWNYLRYAGIFLFAGAVSETFSLRSLSRKLDVNELPKNNLDI